jgi:hypothetical protein
MNATTVVLPYNETAIYDGRLRIGSVVRKFDYALELLTEVEPLAITLGVTAARVKLLVSDAGALTLSGQAAALVRRYRMVSAAGSFALNGFGAGSVRDYVIGTNAGTFTATGQPAALVAERLPLISEAGAFTFVGEDATLRVVQAVRAEVGAFTLTGQSAEFVRNYVVNAEAGSVSLSGQASDFVYTVSKTAMLFYTGTGSALSITGAGFEPGFVALKRRTSDTNHGWYDNVRGVGHYVAAGQSIAEQTLATGLTSFDNDGFSLSTSQVFNASGATYLAWLLPTGGTPASNTNGTITTTVSANQDAEFSAFSYTGDGGGVKTLGHGLSGTPDLVLIKQRAITTAPVVGGPVIGNNNHYSLGSNSATVTTNSNTLRTYGATTIEIGSNLNGSSAAFRCWAFKSKAGTSGFGTFTGSGSATYTEVLGFQPKVLLLKNITTTTSDWILYYRPSGGTGYANLVRLNTNAAEGTSGSLQFTSTGFSVDAGGLGNASGGATQALYWAMA